MSSPARLAVLATLALAACGGVEEVQPPAPLADPVRVSGASPFAAGCNPAPQGATRYVGAEVEPTLAVNPTDPDHLVAATSTDGGRTWRDAPLGGPFDLRTAPDAGGWFLGDYTGLVPVRGGFRALFGMSGASTDLFASR